LPPAFGVSDNSGFKASHRPDGQCPNTMDESAPYKLKYEVYPEDGIYVARCLDIAVASDGASDAEAVANLREAIELYFARNAEAVLSEHDDAD